MRRSDSRSDDAAEQLHAAPLPLGLGGTAWYRIVQAGIVGLSVALAAWWIAVDRTPPLWDQARYLWDSLQYVDAFHRDGTGGAVNAFFTSDPFRGPGYPALVFPFMLVLGPSVQSALFANVLLWIALLLTVAALGRLMFGSAAGLIAMAVTATIPILLILQHRTLVDLAAGTWACLAVLAMLRTAQFTRWLPAVLAGVFTGIGLLTKVSVVLFLAGPVIVIGTRAALRLESASTGRRLRVAGNMLLAATAALVVAGPWYVSNWGPTLSYLQTAEQPCILPGVGPANPLDPAAIAALGLTLLNDTSVWLGAGVVAVGALLLWDRFRAAAAKPAAPSRRGRRAWSWALLISLILVPVGVLMASHSQHARYVVVAFPALAITFAGLCGMLRPRFLRGLVVAAVMVIGLAQIGVAQLPPGSIQSAAVVKFAVGSVGDLQLFAPAYPAADSSGDDGTPVMRELEAVAGGRPVRVLVAEEDHVFNANTLKWLAAVRHDRFTFVRPNVLMADPAQLSSYDLAIYVPAAAVAQRNPDQCIQLLNQTAATTVLGNQLFNYFGRSRHSVPIEGGTAWILER